MKARSKRLSLFFLLVPAGLVMFPFLGALVMLIVESFQTYIHGGIIQVSYSFTLENYVTYFGKTFVYYGFLWDTIRLAGIAVVISVLMAYPMAYKIIRSKSKMVKKILLTTTIALFFVSTTTKVYSWVVILGDAGVVNSIMMFLGFHQTRYLGSDAAIIIGLIYFLIPIATLALIGPIKNVDPLLEQGAMNLGATMTKTFLRITLPLSMPGIIASTLLVYAIGVSSFIIPAFLGRGLVFMMANVIYKRFSETFNYPGGAALSVVLVGTTLFMAYGIGAIMMKKMRGFR
jgi:putative spermidine/putrescine transport system permease protein